MAVTGGQYPHTLSLRRQGREVEGVALVVEVDRMPYKWKRGRLPLLFNVEVFASVNN